MRGTEDKNNKKIKNRFIASLLFVIMVIALIPTVISKAEDISEDSEITARNSNILNIPITIRDYQRDYFFFELSGDKPNDVWNIDFFKVDEKLSNNGKPTFTKTAVIDKTVTILKRELNTLRWNPNTSTSRLATSCKKFIETGSVSQQSWNHQVKTIYDGTLADAKQWYERVKNLSHQSIYNNTSSCNYDSNNSYKGHYNCNKIDTAYRHVYYYLNKFFDDLSVTNNGTNLNYSNGVLNNNITLSDKAVGDRNIVLTWDESLKKYSYDSKTEASGFYFPIDNDGFGNETLNNSFKHNVHFSVEGEVDFFTDTTGETLEFKFEGDDDVWIFVDDELAVD